MDHNVPTNQEQPMSENNKKKLKGLFFLEIGLLEIGFILILLSIFFFTLNFFNILKISKVAPLFSFLPHITQSTNKSPASAISSTEQPIQLSNIQAQILLLTYIKSLIKPNYLPTNLDKSNVILDKNQIFTTWEDPQTSSGIAKILYEDNQVIKLKRFIIQLNTLSRETLASSSAQDIFQAISSLSLKRSWYCINSTDCNTTAFDLNNKSYLKLMLNRSTHTLTFIECDINKQSSLFPKSISCT